MQFFLLTWLLGRYRILLDNLADDITCMCSAYYLHSSHKMAFPHCPSNMSKRFSSSQQGCERKIQGDGRITQMQLPNEQHLISLGQYVNALDKRLPLRDRKILKELMGNDFQIKGRDRTGGNVGYRN